MKQLPHDPNAEAAVLSAMMIDKLSIAKALERLEETDFYLGSHKIIFRSIISLFEDNIDVDIIVLRNYLEKNKNLDRIGGDQYLNKVSDLVLSDGNMLHHIKIVKDNSLLREMIITSENIIKQCHSSEKDTEDVISEGKSKINDIGVESENTVYNPSRSIEDTLDYIEQLSKPVEEFGYISNIPSLDNLLGRILPGEFVVIAGKKSEGKTLLACQIAFMNCFHRNKNIVIFTLEMMNRELMLRQASSIAREPFPLLRRGKVNNYENFTAKMAELSKKHYTIDDASYQTPDRMRARLIQLSAKRRIDIVVFDYSTLITCPGQASKQLELAEISKFCKSVAKDFNCTPILLSQLNNEGMTRGAEDLENDANIVIKLRNPYKRGQAKINIEGIPYEPIPINYTTCEVTKSRNGKTGYVNLCLNGDYQEFLEWSHELAEFADKK